MQPCIVGHFGINGNKKDLFIHGNVGKNGYKDTINEILDCSKPLVIYNISHIVFQEFYELDEFFDQYFNKIDIVDHHYIYVKK